MFFILTFTYIAASRGAGAQSVAVNTTGCRFDPYSRKWNICLIYIYLHFFALVSRQKTRRFSNSTDNGKQTVLTLSSIYLPCCVKLIWFLIYSPTNIKVLLSAIIFLIRHKARQLTASTRTIKALMKINWTEPKNKRTERIGVSLNW